MNAIKHTVLLLALVVSSLFSRSQSAELQQLILNIEKLNQLRAILDQMYTGYKILEKGYTTIKNITEGNFDLHKTFLDGLFAVSPTVRNYKRVVEIITIQQKMVKEYKSALNKVQTKQVFNPRELDYLGRVYRNLMEESLQNMEELLIIITSGQLRMNDAERLNAIDRMYDDMSAKLQFLRRFTDHTAMLAAQRQHQQQSIDDLRRIYGIQK